MKKFRIEGIDAIALTLILGGVILILAGKNGATQSLLTVVVAYYFGTKNKP